MRTINVGDKFHGAPNYHVVVQKIEEKNRLGYVTYIEKPDEPWRNHPEIERKLRYRRFKEIYGREKYRT